MECLVIAELVDEFEYRSDLMCDKRKRIKMRIKYGFLNERLDDLHRKGKAAKGKKEKRKKHFLRRDRKGLNVKS